MRRRFWKPAEDLLLLAGRECRVPAAELATELRRPIGAVYQRAMKIGCPRLFPWWPKAVLEKYRTLHRRGLPDRVIAERMGMKHDQAKAIRQRFRLPCNRDADAKRRSIANQRKTLGIGSGGQLRAWAIRRFARESGWPEDLRLREVQVLNVLAARGVLMTRLELAAAIGMRTDRMGGNGTLDLLRSNSNGGTCTAALMRRGLVICLKRAAVVHGRGKGRSRDMYTLGPEAVRLLQERAQCQATESRTATPAATASRAATPPSASPRRAS